MTSPDPRLDAAVAWLMSQAAAFELDPHTLRPASSDASFRRYFRIDSRRGDSLILMDAPPDQEDSASFVRAQRELAAAGVNVPAILCLDLELGFLLLSDFGDATYFQRLNDTTAASLYADATRALIRLQQASRAGVFPLYDRSELLRELRLFEVWYLARHKGVVLSTAEQLVIDNAFAAIVEQTVAQPAVYVHRDYHSRNLMVLDGSANPGVLDFQDARYGPITYDLVSLLKDAYIAWDENTVLELARRYWECAHQAGLSVPANFAAFRIDLEWMGLQRHLKVLGIFARLCYRDGKPRYLEHLPRLLDYVHAVLNRYDALGPLRTLLERIEERRPTHWMALS